MINNEGGQVFANRVLRSVTALILASVTGCYVDRAPQFPRPDSRLEARDRELFHESTGGNEAFFSRIGFLKGPLTLEGILSAARAVPQGTSNLRVPLDSDAVIGGRAFTKGEVIDTGLDLPKGEKLPLGLVVQDSQKGKVIGASCALCHSSYDPESNTIVDGAPNGDLQLGLLLALASNSTMLFPHTDAHPWRYVRGKERGMNDGGRFVYLPSKELFEEAVDKVLLRWPPGFVDAERDLSAAPRQIPSVFSAAVSRWSPSHPFGEVDERRPYGLSRAVYEAIVEGDHSPVAVIQSALPVERLDFSPPSSGTPDSSLYKRGRELFSQVGCTSCHGEAPRIVSRSEVGISPLRRADPRLNGRARFTPEGDTLRVPPLKGLQWSAPYLSDGGVAVSADKVRHGIPDTLLVHVPADPKESLRALLDRGERDKVITVNRSDVATSSMQITGDGHLYWIDAQAGFSIEDQEAIIHFLLHSQE